MPKSQCQDEQRITHYDTFLKSLAKIESIVLLYADEQAPVSATALN